MNIVINGTDFWDGFDAMKYWAPPKSYDRQKWKQEIHEYMLSGGIECVYATNNILFVVWIYWRL